MMVSTVSYDDQVVHKTYCFELDLFARSQNLDSLHFVKWTPDLVRGNLTPSELPCLH